MSVSINRRKRTNLPVCMPLKRKALCLMADIIVICLLVLLSRREVLAINSVLDLNGTFPYLINKTNGQVIEPLDYMDFENIYAPNETYKQHQTAQGRNYHLIKAFDFANYYQSDYWHYSNEQDLRSSAQPVANEAKCAQQLDWLERKINITNILFKSGEQHVNLMSFMDSFGRPEASTYSGHAYWLGSYLDCKRASIDMAGFEREECQQSSPENYDLCKTINNGTNLINGNINTQQQQQQQQLNKQAISQRLKGRYCIGKVRDNDWPKTDDYVPFISYKTGLCLPEVCETLSIKQHKAQIERLMYFNMPDYVKSHLYLHDMYCLPDNRSPVRAISLSGRIFLSICCAWLVTLILASCLYSCHKRHQKDHRQINMAKQVAQCRELARDLEQQTQMMLVVDEKPIIRDEMVCNDGMQPLRNNAQVMVERSQYLNNIAATCQKQVDEINNGTMCAKNLLSNVAPMLIAETKPALNVNTEIEIPNGGPMQRLDLSDSRSDSSSYRSTSSTFSSWIQETPKLVKILRALSISENIIDFQKPPPILSSPHSLKRVRINLNALDSIKCLCSVMVIFGHIVFIHMQHLSNIVHTIELSHQIYPRVLIAFFNFVDTFFIISGLLTSYFVFKRFNKVTFRRPIVWISFSMMRLARLSPVYILTFWFAKTMTVHLSEGPIWDYGTDKNSIKGLCINDHWWKSLLYLGNVNSMQPICILPAWSIIVDAQYSLIIPPILFLIFKHKKLGYSTLLIAIIVTTANMSHQLATQTAVRTSDMAKLRLHVYPLISRFAAEFYNTAWNRVGPVAIGILGGHLLYLYDIGAIRRWPWYMRGAAFKLVLLLHLVIFILPTIGRFTDDPESAIENDMTIFIISNATIKPIWSLINTIFLLRLVTDLRKSSLLARLMSHNIWHCLGKLCFGAYLMHYEIILVLLKSRQDGLIDPNWTNVVREFSLAFLISTFLAYWVYILFEAPINRLIKPK